MESKSNRLRLQEAGKKGTAAEKKVVNWLKKEGCNVMYWHNGKKSSLPYDIITYIENEKWVIDVKTGKKPNINISNIQGILENINQDKKLKSCNKIGLALVVEGQSWPFLFEYKKMSHLGHKAALTLRRKNAGFKAAETRRQKATH